MLSKKRKIASTNEYSDDLFSSQRSTVQLQRDKVDSNILKDDSVFGELVTAAGFVLRRGDQPNLLKCDQAVFQRNLRRRLKLHTLYRLPEIAVKFKEGLDKHLDDPLRLKWALLYTQTELDCETARGAHQDSLVRMCLNIDELQAPLMTLLTERLQLVAYEDEDESKANIPSLILANLKWLDHITDPDAFTANIIEMIQCTPVKVKQDVITFVPSIVDDTNHPKIAEILCELYQSESELTPAILDTLSQLTLPSESLEDVRHSVLKALQAVKPRHILIVLKFLLSGTRQSTAYQVISDIRAKISLPAECINDKSPQKGCLLSSQRSQYKSQDRMSGEEARNHEVLLLNCIKSSTLCHRFLTTAWLKAIQDGGTGESVETFDFLLLAMLYDAVPSQRTAIMSIIRNKIRAGLFCDSMLTNTFTKHITVLKENFDPIKKIATLLLRSIEPLITHIGVTIYKLSFLHLGQQAQQEVIVALLHLVSFSGGTKEAALKLLTHLTHHHTDDIAPFTVLIKGSLDCVEDLTTGEMRRLLEMVTYLVFSSNSHAPLQEELFILLRKQLSHKDSKYKHIGVLNAAFVLKNMIPTNTEGSTRTNTSSETGDRDNSPLFNTPALKEAENVIHLVFASTTDYPTALALFLDELASIILMDGLNFRIQEWLCDKMKEDFQERFVLDFQADSEPAFDPVLPQGARWDLTEQGDDDEERRLVLNLSPLVLEAETNKDGLMGNRSRLVFLTPQFRLIRMIECRLNEGDLSNIDALLYCPIYAPDQPTLDRFENLARPRQHAVLSCLFYAVNWFRELINAFVTQKEHKKKVYRRLEHILEVEDLLCKYLPLCPSYTPPPASFHLDTTPTLNLAFTSTDRKKRTRKQSSAKGKKVKGKEGETGVEGTQMGTQFGTPMATPAATPQPSQSQPTKNDSLPAESGATLDTACLRPFLRELHIDVFSLLFKELALLTDVASDRHMTVAQAEFLLTDLNYKLAYLFGSKRASPLASDKSLGCSYLSLFPPREVAQRAHTFLKPICKHLEQISAFFQTMIADNDGVMDAANMFSERTQPLITLNNHLFTAMSLCLGWPGLQQEENKDILLAILRTIAKRMESADAVNSMSADVLAPKVCRYVCNFQPSVVSMATAATLVATLTALPRDQAIANDIVDTIEQILTRKWYTSGGAQDTGTAFNQHVHTLLQEYLRLSENPLQQLEVLCAVALKEFQQSSEKDPVSETYPTLHKGSLGVYYRVILSFLVSSTKKALSKLSNSSENHTERLKVWDTAIKVLHSAVELLKRHNSIMILISCLKFGRQFLELFVRNAMPLLDSCLRQHKQEVLMLIRNLQNSTRYLQHVCTHSKVRQDVRLTLHVPPLKKSLETLLYRVKQMFSFNNCTNAFWFGILKNRDLQGQLLSEPSNDEPAERGGEELDVSNEESDVELQDEDEEDRNEDDDKSADYSSSF